jgi:hypothetical protein
MGAGEKIAGCIQGASLHIARARRICIWNILRAAAFFLLASLAAPHLVAQGVPGKTITATVPMVSESWSKTALARPPQPPPAEEDDDSWQPPAYIQAKQQAEAKRQTAAASPALSFPRSGARAQSITTITPLKVFPGPTGGTPPDPMIAAGPNHLLVSVNSEIDVYDKTGVRLSTTTLTDFFAAFNTVTCCFDPRILYDQLHQRFVLLAAQQLAGVGNSHILFAISQTSDPTGAWNKYSLDYSEGNSWPDFPGLGISQTAVYITNNQIPYDVSGPASNAWATVIPFSDLLAGTPTLNITRFENLKSPSGAFAYFVEPAVTYGNSDYEYLIGDGGATVRLFSINTVGPPTITETEVPVPAYNFPPSAPQPDTSLTIDTRSSVVLSPVWRNGSLWFTQNIASENGASVVLRWYELDTASAATKQVGTITYGGNAYFGALTVLPSGEVTMVFCTSASDEYVSVGYAHRSPSDPPNVMSFQSGYQQGYSAYTGFKRWGDLNSVSLDPDGSTVWAIGEYADQFSSSATEIAQLGNYSAAALDFSISPTPLALSARAGDSVSVDVAVVRQNGFTEPVSFSVSGLPAQATAVFTPSSAVTRSTLSITAGQGIAPGDYPLTITGTRASAGLVHSSNVVLTVLGNPDFSVRLAPDTVSVHPGDSSQFNLAITPLSGFNGTVGFDVVGLPHGTVASFVPATLTGAGSMVVNITSSSLLTPVGRYPVTFIATNGSLAHSVQALYVVTPPEPPPPPPSPDFTISATPTTATVSSGQVATYSIAISTTGGFSAPISFACSGLPANSNCTFTPNPVQGSTATLRIATGTTLALAPLPMNRILYATIFAGFGALGILFVIPRGTKGQNRKMMSAFGGVLLGFCLLQIGCGGGGGGGLSSSSPPGGSGGNSTPPNTTATTNAGSYKITVVGTSGSLQHSTTVQLVVQ